MTAKTEANDRELRIVARLQKCVHFNGVQNKVCEAGVSYSTFEGKKFPCLGNAFPNDVRPVAECDSRQPHTREESEAREAEIDAALNRGRIAVPAAHEHAKASGLGQGHGGYGELACPICKIGTLRYSVAGYNGHMHAACTTDKCVSWME